jgi:hypothetical protein
LQSSDISREPCKVRKPEMIPNPTLPIPPLGM